MRQFGLIGYPLSHSFSKKYFTGKFEEWKLADHNYELFSIEDIDMFPALIKTWPSLVGLNVTIPYKQLVIPYLDRLDDAAKDIGAVNTIKFEDGQLIGYNSDVYGFEHSLLPMLSNEHDYRALVLGSGGASKGVVWVLNKLGIPHRIVSRKSKEGYINYENITPSVLANHKLIVNTTPLGMSPNQDSFPQLPYEALTSEHVLYDLVYNPEITLFMEKGMKANASVKNGLEMLHLQADRSWEIWNL